ncbi:MAG: hypothetical protein WC831_01795 [Parcubacteria group bacterium]|jgi:hypothetical protein
MPEKPNYDVSIYGGRLLTLDTVVPEKYVWEFMKEFGEAWEVEKQGLPFKSVDGYYKHPNGWHVQVKIGDIDEEKFYNFIRGFCQQRGLSFREPTRYLLGFLRTLRQLEERANKTPAPDLLDILPPKDEIERLLQIAQHLNFLYLNHQGFQITEKYQKKV